MKEKKYCPNHPKRVILSKGLCRNCYEKQLLERNPEYKERQRENAKEWGKKNKKRKAEWDKQYRQLKGPQTDKRYFSTILKKFGLTQEEYNKMEKKCKLCNKLPYKGKRLHLDHNHETGEIRGLLCTRCNWYLHTIENDPSILNRIKDYLKL